MPRKKRTCLFCKYCADAQIRRLLAEWRLLWLWCCHTDEVRQDSPGFGVVKKHQSKGKMRSTDDAHNL